MSRASGKSSKSNTITLRVALNGTDQNPFGRYGLKQNPFPQIAEHGFAAHCIQLQKLGGEPIKNVEQIRETLKGWDPEFVEMCCRMYRPGKLVQFVVEFPR